MKSKETTKTIEDKAINHIVRYLKKHKKIRKKDIKIVKRGIDIIAGDLWIEAKGCNKTETNIRITPQSLDYVAEQGKLKNYFIYYVYDMKSKNPKLLILNYKTFKKHRHIEIKYIIQPAKIRRETGKPEIIDLK